MDSLPVLNYGSTDRGALAKAVTETVEDFGFLYLENVPGYREEELRWCVEFFFSLSEAKKLECARKLYNPSNNHRFRGYFGINQVGSSFKEGFEVGSSLSPDDPELKTGYPMTENTTWPEASKGQDSQPFEKFRNTMERYFKLLYEVSVDLMRLIALGLGLHEHYFDSLFIPKHLSTFRIINYPVHNFDIPPDAYSPDDGKLLSTAAHRDSVMITLLNTLGYEGLQVQCEDGSWVDMKTRKDCLVVNLGETLSKLTGRRVKATIHRVLAIGRSRQSVPFFLEPGYHAMVPYSLPQDPEKEVSCTDHPKEDLFEYGPWMKEFMQRFVEYKGFAD